MGVNEPATILGKKNYNLSKLLVEHKKEVISAFGLFGLGLGFWTLFSYASLIGRPELFLSSITIGPSLFAWIATFVFCVGVFFVFIWISSLLYLFTVGLFRARPKLKRFVSMCVLCFILLTFSVFMVAAMVTESAVHSLFIAFLVCFIAVVAVSALSRSGELLLKSALKRGVKKVNCYDGDINRAEGKRTKAFKKLLGFFYLVRSNIVVRLFYERTGVAFLWRNIKEISLNFIDVFCRTASHIKAFYYRLLLTLVLTLCSIFMFYPSYLMYKVTSESGGGTIYAVLGAVISFEYGVLPGVIYFNSKERGRARLSKLAIILFISALVILGATKGVFEKVLSYTALTMGVRLSEVREYLIDTKYPMDTLDNAGWEVESFDKYHKVRGLLVYQFASVIYICPPEFSDQKISWWAEHSGSCLIGEKSTIFPFVGSLSSSPAQTK